MSRSDLILFKEKFNTSDTFIQSINILLDKLIEYEYISYSKANSLVDKLIENVKYLTLGTKNKFDYKSGFYDANKKELYIKDEKNIYTVFLRVLYAMLTIKKDDEVYSTGYAITSLKRDSYKLAHYNFGINRAVMCNLVYKICNLIPVELQINVCPKTYSHNFLGYKIETANDMYALEAKLVSEMCYVLNLDIEILYKGLFSKDPTKFLNNIIQRKHFKRSKEFLELLDKISRNYNTYNKLAFLSQKLNDNYLEFKKNALTKDTKNIQHEKEIIEDQIATVINYLYPEKIKDDEIENNKFDDMIESTENLEIVSSLSETLENLEESLKEDIINIQDVLAEELINSYKNLPYSKYANKLKKFNDMLIVPNKRLSKEIENTILFKLMPENEVTGINLIQKIKYAIIESVLSTEDFTNISNTLFFYNITNLENHDNGSSLIVLNSGKGPSKILEIKGLSHNEFNFTINTIALDNLKYIMNSNYSSIYIGDVEKLCTALRNNFSELSYISLDNIFVFEYDNKKYLLVHTENKTYVIEFKPGKNYTFNLLNLSEKYKVFGNTKIVSNFFSSNLPAIYKK